jgi:hypothetical protein
VVERLRIVTRALLVLGALAVAAWFAIGARQAHDTDHAAIITAIFPRFNQVQARRVDSILDSAAFLNPDREIDLLRSQVALASGDRARAQRLASEVTHQEPLNVQAWVQLARAARGPVAARALKYVADLAPPVRAGR